VWYPFAMRRLLLIALLFALAACGSSRALTVEESEYAARTDLEEESPKPDRFLGNLRDGLTDHFRDSRAGLEFTSRTMSRRISEDWDRLVETFR